MKYLITSNNEHKIFKDPPKGYLFYRIGVLSVLIEEDYEPEKKDGKIMFMDGYLRDHSKKVEDVLDQKAGVMEALSVKWPLPENISGSFSCVLINEPDGEIILSTDLAGIYPLYYLKRNGHSYFSNSIILTGVVSEAELDPSGIAQRCLGPDFFNLGSRTILKDCKRLLPGENRRNNMQGDIIYRDFDNSLYNDITGPSQSHSLAKNYWEAYREEVSFCLNRSLKVNIALSGGIDSRIALGAIPQNKEISCYTFGKENNYESKVAKRLADIKGAKFIPCSNQNIYFPSSEKLWDYTLKTEGIELCSWLEITEIVESKFPKEPLILGELCEGLPGRKISRFNSREFRKKNFIKYYLRNKDYQFEASSKEKFESWKKKKLKQYEIYYNDRNLEKLGILKDKKILIEALYSDVMEIFDRIEAHKLPYTELYEELFSWYTYTRMRLSKQLLTANSKFEAFSPAMSLRILRLTSNLHPNLRLNYRFIKKLFAENKELRKLYKIPTSQAPIIPQNAPDFLKFAVWGIRSRLDQYFIKRLMKAKDPKKRYRLFPSINWVKVYQNPDLEKNINDYFEDQHLGDGYISEVKKQAFERRDLKQWPFANMNIINAASLNAELDLIRTYKDKYEI